MATKPTPDRTDDEYRASAELVDDAPDPADWYVAPPTLTVREGVPTSVVEAVTRALWDHPNHVSEPVLYVPGDDGSPVVAALTARYEELPVASTDGPEPLGWLPPYRAREEFDAALRESLDTTAYGAEAGNSHRTDFYERGADR